MRFRSLKRLTEPAVEPVTLAEAKKHLRVEHDADDALITASIVAAREWCETYLDATLIHTQWQMTLDFFPVYIRLPKPPMATAAGFTDVTLTYTTDSSTIVTLPTADYRIDRDSFPGELRPNYSESWPPYRADFNAITVTWYAGYGADGTSVPQRIRNGILMLLTNFYEQRNAVLVGQGFSSKPIEFGLRALLDSAKWGGYA